MSTGVSHQQESKLAKSARKKNRPVVDETRKSPLPRTPTFTRNLGICFHLLGCAQKGGAMTLPKNDSRRRVLRLAILAVEKASRDGVVVNATVEARRIRSEIDAGNLSVDEIADDIARLAAEKGLAVEFGE